MTEAHKRTAELATNCIFLPSKIDVMLSNLYAKIEEKSCLTKSHYSLRGTPYGTLMSLTARAKSLISTQAKRKKNMHESRTAVWQQKAGTRKGLRLLEKVLPMLICVV